MPAEPITLILQEFAAGDKSALDRLLPLVYAELRRVANRHLEYERDGHTLQPTALVHEAYIRLTGQEHPDYRNKAHFMSVAAQLMRQILIDHARARNAGKRGAGQVHTPLHEVDAALGRPVSLIAVDDALNALANEDPLAAKLIEMRFFGGLTAEESAEVLGLPTHRVRAELRLAQAWLQRELKGSTGQQK